MLEMIISILGGLALFLFGMKTMSDGLQKVAGATMRLILARMTGNRFSGVLTGLLVTSVIQSSSATTVMLVSFVSAGLLSLTQAVGVVMGANIGTSITGWIVALFGFKFQIVWLSFPAIFIGFLPRLTGMRRLADVGEVLLGFGILFLGLNFMKDSVEQLKDSSAILAFVQSVDATTLTSRIWTVIVGAVVTMIVQSSSATMTITMTLAAQGIIDVPSACALVLGENIGTTITANLAALSGSREAKQTAITHSLFNISGAVWAILLFNSYLQLIDAVVPGNMMNPANAAPVSMMLLASHVAMFHTLFNVINTLLFLPFVNQLAWIATLIIPSVKKKNGNPIVLYLDPQLISSPPVALHVVRLEVRHMLQEVKSMLDNVLRLAASPVRKQGAVANEIISGENKVDYLEQEITGYLVRVTHNGVSLDEAKETASILEVVTDLERMGDHCDKLHQLLTRRYDQKIEEDEETRKELIEIGGAVSRLVDLIAENLDAPTPGLLQRASVYEDSINRMRQRMRDAHVSHLNERRCSINAGLIFIDMFNAFEKIADHAFNIAQTLSTDRR